MQIRLSGGAARLGSNILITFKSRSALLSPSVCEQMLSLVGNINISHLV